MENLHRCVSNKFSQLTLCTRNFFLCSVIVAGPFMPTQQIVHYDHSYNGPLMVLFHNGGAE